MQFPLLKKYHIAISVAEEDIAYARELAAALKENGIKYYFYEEHPQDAGLPIIDLIARIYGGESYIVVVFHSAECDQYWGNIERKFALAKKKRTVLIKLDEAPLDSYYKNFVYLKWKDGLQKLIAALKKMTKPYRVLQAIIYSALLLLLFAVAWIIFHKPTLSVDLSEKRETIIIKADIYAGRLKADTLEVSVTEITVAQYDAYCNANGLVLPKQPRHRDRDHCPVTNITPQQAMDYAKWVGGRLPTSAEWGYMARGNENYNYSGSDQAWKVAVYGQEKISRVGTKDPNAFGLYDMSGNAREWCTYRPYIIPNDSLPARGGDYGSTIDQIKISIVDCQPVNTAVPWIGFRVVWDHKNP